MGCFADDYDDDDDMYAKRPFCLPIHITIRLTEEFIKHKMYALLLFTTSVRNNCSADILLVTLVTRADTQAFT
jgi:hypothetical protein